MMRRRCLLRLGAGALGVALAWLGGFVWFINRIQRPVEPPPHADGIVVLTGGAERVETALRLLQQGRADRLLVSGAGGGVELTALARLAGVDAAPLANRVTLGHTATTTRGNAAETAAWVRSNGVHSLIVVTAYYHMPRALTELQRALPGIELYRWPVLLPNQAGSPPPHPVNVRLLAEEYSKFLLSWLGISGLLPAAPATPSSPAHPGTAE